MTQFAYTCNRLGIELTCNSGADFKPRVERANPDPLPFRLSMEKITILRKANEYLQSTFIPYFNGLFGYDCELYRGPKENHSVRVRGMLCRSDQEHPDSAVRTHREQGE